MWLYAEFCYLLDTFGGRGFLDTSIALRLFSATILTLWNLVSLIMDILHFITTLSLSKPYNRKKN